MAVGKPIRVEGDEQVFSSTCAHNCGGRCIVRVHVRDGQIVADQQRRGPLDAGAAAVASLRTRLRARPIGSTTASGCSTRNGGSARAARGASSAAPGTRRSTRSPLRCCGSATPTAPAAILDSSRTGSTPMLHNKGAVGRLLNLFGGCTELWGRPVQRS